MSDRQQVVERLAAGEGLADAAGLSLSELQPLVAAAEAAFQQGRLPLARRVFAALERLFPDRAAFTLRRAASEAGEGDRFAALQSLERLFGREAVLDSETLRLALQLQVALVQTGAQAVRR
ncbi:MAG: hypothetical protein IPJ65_18255 [Archangiaceae bacterium]|nr:hypothetical protein [Archangiaceae bacterium]